MREVVLLMRSAFCRHEWQYEEHHHTQIGGPVTDYLTMTPNPDHGKVIHSGERVSATCKKCGWHRSYWKF